MSTDTAYVLFSAAVLTIAVGVFAYDYRRSMAEARAVEKLADACQTCIEESGGPGGCMPLCAPGYGESIDRKEE